MNHPDGQSIMPHVLLAECDLLLRRAVAQVAGELGVARVHPVPDVHAAVAEVERQPFDALVLCLDPGGDTFELVTLLRCGQYPSPPDTPVALLTPPQIQPDATRLSSLGIRETLQEPCSARAVLDLIGRLVSGATPGAHGRLATGGDAAAG